MAMDEKVELGWAEETDHSSVEKIVKAMRDIGWPEELIQLYRENISYDRAFRTYNIIRRKQYLIG